MIGTVVLLSALVSIVQGSSCILDPSLPANLTRHAEQQPLCAGFIDASAPPYNCAGDGRTDDTEALQWALDDAYAFRLAVLLQPNRTFVISRQLRAVQTGKPQQLREYGYQLIGAVDHSLSSTPATLKVKDHADLSAFPETGPPTTIAGVSFQQRPIIYYAINTNASNPGGNYAAILYSALLRNIRIDLGDNPGLSGVAMSGAQLCSIEDVTVVGTAFTSGVVGLPGSGGYSSNLRVVGGHFAIWQAQFRPNPSVTGLVALNQTVAAVLLILSRGPLVLSGFVIRSQMKGATGVLVAGKRSASVALEDGVIAVSGTAITANGNGITLRAIWVQSALAVEVAVHGLEVKSTSNAYRYIAWWHYSSAQTIAVSKGEDVSAATQASGFPALSYLPSAPAATPPPDTTLGTMHSWTEAEALSMGWESSCVLDVVRDCGATPHWVNATDNDGTAITQCLRQALSALPAGGRTQTLCKGQVVVFVPRGEFLLWETLVIPRQGLKLVGAGKHNAVLTMRAGVAFDAAPLLRVDGAMEHNKGGNNSTAASVVSDLVLVQSQRAPVLEVRTATLLRDVRTVPCNPFKWRLPNQPRCAHPASQPSSASPSSTVAAVAFTGTASGRFYGLSLDHFTTFLEAGDALVTVNHTGYSAATEGIHLYQLSAEHLATNYQLQVSHSNGLHLHAFKFESAGILKTPPPKGPNLLGGGLFACLNSSQVTIFGGSGNYGIMNVSLARDIIFSSGCNDIQLDALVRNPVSGETPPSHANWVSAVSSGEGAGSGLQVSDNQDVLLTFSPKQVSGNGRVTH